MVVIKKIKDKFYEKQAEYIIYSHNGKNWIYKVSGEPINDLDIELLMQPKRDCLCGCHTSKYSDSCVCGECYRKNCIRLRMKTFQPSLSNVGGK